MAPTQTDQILLQKVFPDRPDIWEDILKRAEKPKPVKYSKRLKNNIIRRRAE